MACGLLGKSQRQWATRASLTPSAGLGLAPGSRRTASRPRRGRPGRGPGPGRGRPRGPGGTGRTGRPGRTARRGWRTGPGRHAPRQHVRVGGVGLAQRAGDVPAVHGQLVGGGLADHHGGGVHPGDSRRARPGVRLPPGLRQPGQVPRDTGAPVGGQPGGVPGRLLPGERAGVLARRGGERERHAADVLDQVTQRVRRARRRQAQVALGDAGDQIGKAAGPLAPDPRCPCLI